MKLGVWRWKYSVWQWNSRFSGRNILYVNRIRGSAFKLEFGVGNHLYRDGTLKGLTVKVGVQQWNWGFSSGIGGSAVELEFGGENDIYSGEPWVW